MLLSIFVFPNRYNMGFRIRRAVHSDTKYIPSIVTEIAYWAKFRSTGVTSRTIAYVTEKLKQGVVLIAVDEQENWIGFSYLEVWKHGRYVANSGLIVKPKYRNSGLALHLKQEALQLAATTFPHAKVFSLTTSLSVAKHNLELGYRPVPPENLLADSDFTTGCGNLLNYPAMVQTHQENSECFTMVFDPAVSRLRKVS